jgi:hypothetical protein
MCKHYRKDTCSNMHCTFAHEGDGFPCVVPYTRLKSESSGPSPADQARLRAKGRIEPDKAAHTEDDELP